MTDATTPAPDPLASLTVENVAVLLQLAPKTVRAMCKRGELRSVTVARRVRIPRAAVAELLAGANPPSSRPPSSELAWPELSARAPARRPRGRPRRSASTASNASSSPSSRGP